MDIAKAKPGLQVKLKIDPSPEMVVVKVAGDEVSCVWIGKDLGQLHRGDFPPSALTVIPLQKT